MAKKNRGPYRYVFGVLFHSEKALQKYREVWEEGSKIIQKEPGARGTRLHRAPGCLVLIVIAEWESKAARVRAFRRLKRRYPPTHVVHTPDERYGRVITIGGMHEIALVKNGKVVAPQ